MSFGGSPTPDTRAQDILNEISQGQTDIYNENYKPVEGILQAQIEDPNFIQNMRTNATDQIGIGSIGASGAADRTQKRYGISNTPGQKAALDRRFSLAEASATTNAANQAGNAAYDVKMQGLAGITDLGHQTASSSLSTANSMAALEQNRNANNANIKAADDAGTISAIGTGIGLAFAI